AAALRRGSARRLLLRLRPRDAVAGEGSARGRARLFRAALRRDTGHVAARWFHRRCRRALHRATHGGGARARGAPRRRARRARAEQGGGSVRVSLPRATWAAFAAPMSSPRTRGTIFQRRWLWVPAFAGKTAYELIESHPLYDHTRPTSLPITW